MIVGQPTELVDPAVSFHVYIARMSKAGTSRAWLSLGILERCCASLVPFREGGGLARCVERGIDLHLSVIQKS